ncbi:hypothetical protein BDZ89DRAFT_1133896 [Hymenopellis radicata]|nr:hypothetical protein BDZ89DRAFT_1133896 [Hymenopellis radicata]
MSPQDSNHPSPQEADSQESYMEQRLLPPAAHLMSVHFRQEEELAKEWDPSSIIAYAIGDKPQPDEDALVESVERVIKFLLPPTTDISITPIHASEKQTARWNFPWRIAFHDPNDGERAIVAVVTDLDLDDSDESCERVYESMAATIRRSSELHDFVREHRDLYPLDAPVARIIEHMACSLNVTPYPSGPTAFNPDASHTFVVHIPPTTANIEGTKKMVEILNEKGVRTPHGWGDLDDATLPILCMRCFAMDHPAEECKVDGRGYVGMRSDMIR